MSAFPETSMTLLKKIAVQVTGEREAAWVRFFGLYEPAIKRFVAWHDSSHDPDDVVQDIFLKLVNVVQSGGYDSSKGSFRAFLSTMIRRHLVSLYRKDQARGAGLHVDIDDAEPSVSANVAEQIDLKWRMARHQSAIEHVLTKTAISAQSRDIYRAYVEDGRSLDEVVAQFGVTKAVIYKIKSRVEQMAAIIEEEFADEK
ncbi:MAG: sigma-70 family RNA polymerase sigma factor [Kiritimatiellae bacterium]|nr:sigma-70 family RNA polymerase sigma factor [Kiritimatiellia bacterium]MBQ3098561.1 sigma-70 family RNA polymerase sigma factor [Kiritimatiellia bacterium]